MYTYIELVVISPEPIEQEMSVHLCPDMSASFVSAKARLKLT